MIYKVDDDYVISSHNQWLPGAYDSKRTANYAFRFPNEILYKLNNQINITEQRLITYKDLQDARKNIMV